MNTSIQVDYRPVTQQGLAGLKSSGGPARQVADKTYWLTELQTRTKEVRSEIDKLTQEKEQTEKDALMYAQLERQYDTMTAEVKKLENQLTDTTFALQQVCVSIGFLSRIEWNRIVYANREDQVK